MRDLRLFFSLILLGGLVAACDLSLGPPPTATGEVRVTAEQVEGTPTPLITPSATPLQPRLQTPRCPAAPLNRVIVQERARVIKLDENDTESLNLRSGPGLEYNTLYQIAPGESFFVLEGPECAGGYSWYRIIYNGRDGWVAEGDDQQYFVEPFLPG